MLLNNGTTQKQSWYVYTMTAQASLNVMTCLDVAQYAVCMMSATVQPDKFPEFYMTALTF